MDWVASTLHTTSEHCVTSIATADAHTTPASSRLKSDPADLNGLVRFAERRNLVSAHVPSHFIWPLLLITFQSYTKLTDSYNVSVQYHVEIRYMTQDENHSGCLKT